MLSRVKLYLGVYFFLLILLYSLQKKIAGYSFSLVNVRGVNQNSLEIVAYPQEG